ncbi:DUF262 domain-containing HNH endonuclease family protein [Roseomonas sp. CAU 1739]|uniref:DUF262 domain-containing protein n=1 Tax=Roseomonas sp. CAU 1739 TaxID=3140364 RepID=UPI00325AE2C2
MSIHPALESVGHLFGTNLIFRVPRYQRYYAWDAEQIADFLTDLELCVKARAAGTTREHFFGGLVTVRTNVEGSSRQNMEVIDGQQRLASFFMLAAQLRNAALQLADAVDTSAADNPKEFLQAFAKTLKAKYERYEDKIKLQVVEIDRLELSKPDLVFFKDLIEGRNPTTSRTSHKLLKQAWDRIGAKLAQIVAAESADVAKAEALSRVDTVMEEDWILIHMITDSKAEAYRLFRVLNDRGTGLTEGELLRAQLLEALDGVATSAQMQSVEETWDTILGEPPEVVEQQLRSIYASMIGKRPGKTTLLDEFLAGCFPELASLPLSASAVQEVVAKVQRLHVEINLLVKLQGGEWPFPSSTKVTAWDRSRLGLLINELKHTNCMPLLLAAAQLVEKDFAEVVQMLERLMFRYKIICDAHIGAATSIYHAQAVKIRKASTSYKIAELRKELQGLLDKSANDMVFKSRLQGMMYSRELTNKPLKYLLITLESYLRWYRAGAKGAPKCLDKMVVFDPSATTVEHVYPEKASPADGTLEPLLDTLGNLTLLGSTDNDAAGNKPFSKKKTIFEKSLVGLNQEIAKNTAWTAAVVEARQTDLEKVALKVFRMTA